MYCPNCNAEYRPDFTMCSDCNVALVQDLSTLLKADRLEWKSILDMRRSSILLTLQI